MQEIGRVTHFYDKLSVAIIKLTVPLAVGDEVEFHKGEEKAFSQKVESLQFNHAEVDQGKKGQEIGLKVEQKVREGEKAFKL